MDIVLLGGKSYTCVFLVVWYLKKNLRGKTERIFQIPHMTRFYTQNIIINFPRTLRFMLTQSFLKGKMGKNYLAYIAR